MQQDISKMCADSLRTFTSEKLNIKIKAAHAHELFSAYAGYPSKNAMLADYKYSINNLPQAKIVVMVPDAYIDQRRNDLEGLSPDLPDSYALGEPIYASLFSDEYWASEYPPFRDFKQVAKILIEKDYNYQETFRFYQGIPMHHFVSVIRGEDGITLSVIHATQTSETEMLGNGKTIIELPRVAGHIGYAEPKMRLEQWTGGARKKLSLSGEELHLTSW